MGPSSRCTARSEEVTRIGNIHFGKGEPHREVGRSEDGIMGGMSDTFGSDPKISLEKRRKGRDSTGSDRAYKTGKGTIGEDAYGCITSDIEEKMAPDLVRVEIGVGQVDACATHQIFDLFGDQSSG